MYVAHRRIFADVPYTFFVVLRCHTRTTWQCLGWCNLRIAERIAGGRPASTMSIEKVPILGHLRQQF